MKHNLHIPIKFGLIGKISKKDLISSDIYPDSQILNLKEGMQTFEIPNITEDCIPSILRDFSAPVKLIHNQSIGDLSFLMAYDSDPVNKWMASQTLLSNIILERVNDIKAGNSFKPISGEIIGCFKEALKIPDKEMKV